MTTPNIFGASIEARRQAEAERQAETARFQTLRQELSLNREPCEYARMLTDMDEETFAAALGYVVAAASLKVRDAHDSLGGETLSMLDRIEAKEELAPGALIDPNNSPLYQRRSDELFIRILDATTPLPEA